MEVLAVIFDLDGTVISDENEYGAAFAEVLGKLGAKVDSPYPQVGGIGVRENWAKLLKEYHIKTNKSIDELALQTQEAYLKRLENVNLKEGLVDFIDGLKASGILTALATSNDWWVVEEIYESLNLRDYFDALTTGEEVAFKKPDPEIFNITADKLEVGRTLCVVIEDSKAGISAAHEASMKAVGIYRNENHKKTLSDADMLIPNFNDINLDTLADL